MIISVIGSGGKTTKIKQLKDQYLKEGKSVLITTSTHMKIEEITDFKILKDLKNLEDKKEWRAYSNDTLLVSWKDWENITVPTHEIEAAPVASRSFIKFHNAIKRVFGNA